MNSQYSMGTNLCQILSMSITLNGFEKPAKLAKRVSMNSMKQEGAFKKEIKCFFCA